MVLVDTSVWIDFFSSSPKPISLKLPHLIEARQVVTSFVVLAEVLSGQMQVKTHNAIRDSFQSLGRIDADWNAVETWESVSRIAEEIRSRKLKVPGLVDRMLFFSARQHSALVWTYDLKLGALCRYFKMNFVP